MKTEHAGPVVGRERNKPSSLHPQTIHPTTCNLHPKPFTQHPAPYTLHPTLYTLHPTPYTLHPTTHALHPTPYTFHPTPLKLANQTTDPAPLTHVAGRERYTSRGGAAYETSCAQWTEWRAPEITHRICNENWKGQRSKRWSTLRAIVRLGRHGARAEAMGVRGGWVRGVVGGGGERGGRAGQGGQCNPEPLNHAPAALNPQP